MVFWAVKEGNLSLFLKLFEFLFVTPNKRTNFVSR